MRDRLEAWQADGALPVVMATPTGGARDEVNDAVSALVALGYKPPEASKMVSAIDSDGKNSEQIIRAALQKAVKK